MSGELLCSVVERLTTLALDEDSSAAASALGGVGLRAMHSSLGSLSMADW